VALGGSRTAEVSLTVTAHPRWGSMSSVTRRQALADATLKPGSCAHRRGGMGFSRLTWDGETVALSRPSPLKAFGTGDRRGAASRVPSCKPPPRANCRPACPAVRHRAWPAKAGSSTFSAGVGTFALPLAATGRGSRRRRRCRDMIAALDRAARHHARTCTGCRPRRATFSAARWRPDELKAFHRRGDRPAPRRGRGADRLPCHGQRLPVIAMPYPATRSPLPAMPSILTAGWLPAGLGAGRRPVPLVHPCRACLTVQPDLTFP
jgi:hypothetical protein